MKMSIGGGEFAVKYYAFETLIHAATRENINDILDYGPDVDDDRLTAPHNKPIATDETD